MTDLPRLVEDLALLDYELREARAAGMPTETLERTVAQQRAAVRACLATMAALASAPASER